MRVEVDCLGLVPAQTASICETGKFLLSLLKPGEFLAIIIVIFFFSFIKTPCVRLYCDERVSLSELTSGTFLLLFFFSSPLPLPITLVVLCGYTHVSVCLCMWRRWTPPDHSCVAFLSGGKEKTKVRGKHKYAETLADVLL